MVVVLSRGENEKRRRKKREGRWHLESRICSVSKGLVPSIWVMSCMRVYEKHADKAGVDQASFQVVDRTIRDANFLKLPEGCTILADSHRKFSGRHRLTPMNSYSLSLPQRRFSLGMSAELRPESSRSQKVKDYVDSTSSSLSGKSRGFQKQLAAGRVAATLPHVTNAQVSLASTNLNATRPATVQRPALSFLPFPCLLTFFRCRCPDL